MTARYVNKLLSDEGCRVKCYAVHPGIVDTDLFEKSLFKKFPWAMKMLFKTPEKGAISILHTCFDKALEEKGGTYISNCVEGISSRYSKNTEYQKRLFEISCDLAKIDPQNYGKGM